MAELQRTLSFPVILLMTIVAGISVDMYLLIQVGAWAAGGWGAIIATLIVVVISLLMSFIFAELVGMFPTEGGIYEYAKQVFGPFPSFLLGWLTLLNLNLSVAVVIVDGLTYLNPDLDPTIVLGISILFAILMHYFVFRGTSVSSIVVAVIGFITLVTIAVFLTAGLPHFDFANLSTPAPADLGVPFFIAILVGVFYIAEIFFVWENSTFLAGYAKDPEKNMPRVMWLSTVITSIIVIAFTIIAVGGVGAETFGDTYVPFLVLSDAYFGGMATQIVAILVYLCCMGAIMSWIIASSLLVRSLAEDKLFIPQMAQLHPKYGTPFKAIILQALCAIVFLIFTKASSDALYDILLPIDFAMYLFLFIVFLKLRFKKPDQHRPFKLWFGVPIAIFLIVALLALVGAWVIGIDNAPHALRVGLSLLLLGIPIYFLLALTYNQNAIARVTESIAYVSLWFESILTPRKIRNDILIVFKNLEGKRVLEYGAGVGTLTMELAEKIGPKGTLIATDISAKNIGILQKRADKRGHSHIIALHDPQQMHRIHPGIKNADIVYSIGMFSYVQDLRRVLKDLERILPQGGEICFVEYVDYFHVMPNAEWLDRHEEIEGIFREEGFVVHVTKVRGLLWNYLFIYGHKRSGHDRNVPYI